MNPAGPRRQHGRGWLELAIALVVLAVLGTFWIDSLRKLQAESEKTMVELTVRSMRTGLQLRLTELMLEQRVRDIPGLAGQNPVQWLEQPPEGYLGELDHAPQDPPPRAWYFDRMRRVLIYVPGSSAFVETSGIAGLPAWRVELGSGVREGGMAGIRLAQVSAAKGN